jgi:hypothetical protein
VKQGGRLALVLRYLDALGDPAAQGARYQHTGRVVAGPRVADPDYDRITRV